MQRQIKPIQTIKTIKSIKPIQSIQSIQNIQNNQNNQQIQSIEAITQINEPTQPNNVLFLNGLPRKVKADELENIFKQYSQFPVKVNLIQNKQTTEKQNQNKPKKAYIIFKTIEDAITAFNECHALTIHGKRITVKYAYDKPKNQNKQRKFSTQKQMKRNYQNNQNNQNNQIQQIQQINPIQLNEMKQKKSKNNKSNKSNKWEVYVHNLNFKITSDILKKIFSKYSPIKAVVFTTSKDGKKVSNGSGVVELPTQQMQLLAVQEMNNTSHWGRKITVIKSHNTVDVSDQNTI